MVPLGVIVHQTWRGSMPFLPHNMVVLCRQTIFSSYPRVLRACYEREQECVVACGHVQHTTSDTLPE